MPSPAKTRPLKPAKEGQPSKTTAARKRQSSARISAACEACKKRKTKCTGGPPPCQLCQSLGTECVIDLTLDMRRRAALQRTVDESKSYQDALGKLIECIRDGSSPRFETLLEYVRGGATNQDVIDAVQQSNGSLDDDSDNASILHNGLQESQSPPSEPVDHPSVFQSQTNGSLPDGEDKHMNDQVLTDGESSSQFGRSKERDPIGDISSLLSRLRMLPTSDSELLLRRILASQGGTHQYAAGYAAGQHSLDGFGRNAVAPSNAERSMWHPALHVRSESTWTEEQRQHLGHNGPFQRRFSELPSISTNSESLFSSDSSISQSPTSHTGPHLSLKTTHTWPLPLQSPISPYVEFTGIPLTKYPVANAWDLSVAQEDQMTRLRIPTHLVLPLIIPDDSILSNMYTNYVEGARHMLDTGLPLTEVLGSSDEVSLELFFRARTENDAFDCASWACEVCRALPVIDDCVRMASAYMLTFMMRWILAPTQANYAKIPDMMKPTPSQRMIPHIGAIEMLPIGPVRDALIYHMRDWLSQHGKANWSINWPFDRDTAIEQDLVTNVRRLTNKFIEHIREYDNWSISREFLRAFPELSGRIRVHD